MPSQCMESFGCRSASRADHQCWFQVAMVSHVTAISLRFVKYWWWWWRRCHPQTILNKLELNLPDMRFQPREKDSRLRTKRPFVVDEESWELLSIRAMAVA